MNRRENVAALACGLAGEVVRRFGEVRLRVFGTSMVPSILPGDLISVQHASVSEISSGEIVLYVREGRMFVHRVVDLAGGTENALLITRGDRLLHNDPPVSSAELLGRVTSIKRGDQQFEPLAQASGSNGPLVRLLQTSDYATYLYLRLAALWGRFAGRIFGRDAVRSQLGFCRTGTLACPPMLGRDEAGQTRVSVPLKANESLGAGFRTEDTEGVVKCQA